MTFRYCAESGVTLHDCDITEWVFAGDVTFVFEDGFDVFSDCPQNDTGRHKHTGRSAVVLKNGKFVSGEASFGNTYYGAGEGFPDSECRPVSKEEMTELELEVLDFKILPDSVFLECDAWKNNGEDAGFCEFEFSCEGVLFQWDEFTDDAWFQN
ncbi:MAG: hypothetical protein K2N56_08460 [Oscillospiraceae bacterium]|nr:hypothetical protein [Oscillospiraceae bacterium]